MRFVHAGDHAPRPLPKRTVMAAALLFVLAHGIFLQIWVQNLQATGHALMEQVEFGLLLSCTVGLLLLCGIRILTHQTLSPLPRGQRPLLTGMRWGAWLCFSLVALFAFLGGFCVLSSDEWTALQQWGTLGSFALIVRLVFVIHLSLERLTLRNVLY